MKKITKIFTSSIIAIVCFIAYQYPLTVDATYNKNNTIKQSNLQLLSRIDKPLKIELITPDRNTHTEVQAIVSLFQKENKNIIFEVKFSNLTPEEKSRLRLFSNHNLLLSYDDRQMAIDLNLSKWNEEAFSNLLHQILKDKEQWIVFLTGHGEQDPSREENRNLSMLSTHLKSKGLKIASLNLGEIGVIPSNTSMLVIADNQAALLPKETKLIVEYLENGGNLLWLVNPNSVSHTTQLGQTLGIQWPGGTIEDPKAFALGAPHPAISIVNQYPAHPITQQVDMLTVFPWSTPIQYLGAEKRGFNVKPLLITHPAAFITRADKKIEGPFTIGAALTKGSQRIVLIGNGHFLSNASIQNYGNLLFANNIFHWLNEADLFLNLPSKPAIDLSLTQTPFVAMTIQYVFPYILPFLYLLVGWQLKRNRLKKFIIGQTT